MEAGLEGSIVIAGVGLLALTLGVLFPYCREETKKGIQKTDEMIISIVKDLTNSSQSKSRGSLLESICKLRRRKSHLQKDNQNFFFLFLFASVCFILIGIFLLFGLGTYYIILKASLVFLSVFSFVSGVYFIWRLFYEFRNIDRESYI